MIQNGPGVAVAIRDYLEKALAPLRDVTLTDVKVTWSPSTGVTVETRSDEQPDAK